MKRSANKHTRKYKKYHGGDDIITTEFTTQPLEELVIEEQPASASTSAPSTTASLIENLKGHFSRARNYLASLTGGRKTRRVRKNKHKRTKSHKRKHSYKHKV